MFLLLNTIFAYFQCCNWKINLLYLSNSRGLIFFLSSQEDACCNNNFVEALNNTTKKK